MNQNLIYTHISTLKVGNRLTSSMCNLLMMIIIIIIIISMMMIVIIIHCDMAASVMPHKILRAFCNLHACQLSTVFSSSLPTVDKLQQIRLWPTFQWGMWGCADTFLTTLLTFSALYSFSCPPSFFYKCETFMALSLSVTYQYKQTKNGQNQKKKFENWFSFNLNKLAKLRMCVKVRYTSQKYNLEIEAWKLLVTVFRKYITIHVYGRSVHWHRGRF